MRIMVLLGWSIIAMVLFAEDLAIVANGRFPLSSLDAHQVRQVFLKKTHYIDDIRLVPINLPKRHPLRMAFEHDVLRLSSSQLRRHWTKAHYRGKRPPLVQHSIKSILAFIRQVDGAIAYIPTSDVPRDLKTLYQVRP